MRIATGVYLSLWAAALAAVVLLATSAGLSVYLALVIACCLFALANGTLAYIARSRQLKQEGKNPPNYLLYLVAPRPLSSPVSVPRPVLVLLAVVLLAGGAVCFLAGILAVPGIVAALQSSSVPFPAGKSFAAAFFIFVALACWYVGARLIQVRTHAERLSPRKHDGNAA